MQPFSITFFYPKPRAVRNFSIEFLFHRIQNSLPPHVNSITKVSSYQSNGFWPRLYNAAEAALRQSNVNHIVGDVHFLTLFLKKRKTVLTIHDCIFMNHPSALARIIFRWFWLVLPIYRSKVITVVSESTKKEVLKHTHCPPEKIRVIPNFISDKFKPHVKLFNTQKPVVLHMGTAINKNLKRLVEALHGITCHLCIVGKLNRYYISLLEQYNIDYSNSFNLTEDEVVHLYEQCDLLAFVSTYEGFGMPILEAQSVGRPVLTSSLSSMLEVAGNGACFVDPYNIADIRKGIIRVVEDERYRQMLICKGRENIKRYSLNTTVEQYLSLYAEILNQKKFTDY